MTPRERYTKRGAHTGTRVPKQPSPGFWRDLKAALGFRRSRDSWLLANPPESLRWLTDCGLCGNRATGFATIGDTRYCHGDFDPEPTCYEQAQWDKVRDTCDHLPSVGPSGVCACAFIGFHYTPSSEDFDPADDMCPNCVTPWKCNGPHERAV